MYVLKRPKDTKQLFSRIENNRENNRCRKTARQLKHRQKANSLSFSRLTFLDAL